MVEVGLDPLQVNPSSLKVCLFTAKRVEVALVTPARPANRRSALRSRKTEP